MRCMKCVIWADEAMDDDKITGMVNSRRLDRWQGEETRRESLKRDVDIVSCRLKVTIGARRQALRRARYIG